MSGNNNLLNVGRASQPELRDQHEEPNHEPTQSVHEIYLIVKNLDYNLSDDELCEAFSQYETVTRAKIMRDEEGSRGFGIVYFSSQEEATKAATEMKERLVGSKPLHVTLAHRRNDRLGQAIVKYNEFMRMTSNMESICETPSPMIEQSPHTAGAPGYHFMPYQGQSSHMPAGYPWTNPIWQQQIHPSSHQIMPHHMAAWQQQPFDYYTSVRNPFMTGYPELHQFQPQLQNQQAVDIHGQEPLTAFMLAAVHPQQRRQILGNRLYPLVEQLRPDLVSKITGMLLDLDNSELLLMLDSRELLRAKVEEAAALWQARQIARFFG